MTSGGPEATWCSVGEPGDIVLGAGGTPPSLFQLPLGYLIVHPAGWQATSHREFPESRRDFSTKNVLSFYYPERGKALIWPAAWPVRGWRRGGDLKAGLEVHHLLQQQLEILPSKPASPCGNPNRPLPCTCYKVDIPRAPTMCLELEGRNAVRSTKLGPSKIHMTLPCLLELKNSRLRIDLGDSNQSSKLAGRSPWL